MSKKSVVLMEFESNPNVGLYMFANNKFCIVGRDIDEKKKKEIESVLGVDVYRVTALSTDLIGVFITGDDDIVISPVLQDDEKVKLIEICEKHDVKFIEFDEKINTFGNNLCVGNSKILANASFPKKFLDELKKKSGYDVSVISHEDYSCAGSVCRFANGKFFVSQELNEKDVELIVNDVGAVGTVNSGSNYVASGIVGNRKGLILGSLCSSVEIQNIVESLDYLD